VRISGENKDSLQECNALLRSQFTELTLTYENFRDYAPG
jgi:uncharacterized protein YajQ (UPF0234 family)